MTILWSEMLDGALISQPYVLECTTFPFNHELADTHDISKKNFRIEIGRK